MKGLRFIMPIMVLICMQGTIVAQQGAGNIEPMLSSDPSVEKTSPKVTAVYGVTADDYLPTIEMARNHLRPDIRKSSSHPSFDLPDAFYFIGGPIFLIILLRVLVIFLNGFEEKRKEELREIASQSVNPE